MSAGRPLDWGRRYLLCPPTFFDVTYRINPWMGSGHAVDPDKAQDQWDSLRDTLVAAGATVEVLDPVPALPDLVFTANAGLVDGHRVVPARFRHAARQGETAVNTAWFDDRGYEIVGLESGLVFEGAGDALPFTGDEGTPVLVGGHGPRSHARAQGRVGDALGVPTVTVGLVDERLYHLDMTFCPLDDRHALIAPDAWDGEGRRGVAELVPEPLVLSRAEAYAFCANSVVVGNVVIMPGCPPEVGRRLGSWGFEVVEVDVSEFRKAGGACRCLTLALDVELSGTCNQPVV